MHTLARSGILLAGSIALMVTTGCASSAKKLSTASTVVATWRGDVIREQRINERVELEQPAISNIDLDVDEEVLRVELVQQKTSRFDLEKTHQVLAARATQWFDYGHKFGGNPDDYNDPRNLGPITLWTFLTVMSAGGYPLLETGTMSVRDAQLRKEETRAIDRLTAGEDEVIVRQPRRYFGGWVYSSNINRRYWREVAGEETELVTAQTEILLAPGSGIPVRLVSPNEARLAAIAMTDESGVAEFALGNDLQEAIDFEADDLRILAEWNGGWIELGTVARAPSE